MKNIYKTSTAYILLTDERLSVKKAGGYTVTIAIQQDTGSSSQHDKKDNQIEILEWKI